MKYLKGSEISGARSAYRLMYCITDYDQFYWGAATANKLFWRFYWVTPFDKKGVSE